MIGHVAPEAALGGPIALVEEGDMITIDVDAQGARPRGGRRRSLAERRARWTPPAPRYTTGVMAKYAALVSSASEGAVTSGAQLRRTLAARTADGADGDARCRSPDLVQDVAAAASTGPTLDATWALAGRARRVRRRAG